MYLRRLFFLLVLLLPLAASAQGTPLQTMDGVIVNVTLIPPPKPDNKPVAIRASSSGSRDAYRLVLRDNQRRIHDFRVGNDKSFLPLIQDPRKFKGKKVRVRWHLVQIGGGSTPMPCMGGEAVSLEVLQP